MAIKHTFVSAKSDGADTSLVRPSNWNEDHNIENNTVTYAKMQDVSAASKLLGRGDSGSGDPQEITIGSGLSMSGTTLSATGGASVSNILAIQQNNFL